MRTAMRPTATVTSARQRGTCAMRLGRANVSDGRASLWRKRRWLRWARVPARWKIITSPRSALDAPYFRQLKGAIPFTLRAKRGKIRRGAISWDTREYASFCALLKSPLHRQILHQDCSNALQAFDSDTLFSGRRYISLGDYLRCISWKWTTQKILEEHLNSREKEILYM